MSPKQGRKRAAGTGKGTPGSGKGRTAAPRRRPGAGPWRNLLIFGGAFVLIFAVVGITVGIGHPSVGSGDVAVVEGVPSEIGTITEADFKKALAQGAAKQQMQKVPKPGEPQYKELKEATLGELLTKVWLQGQAEEMGISATDKEVSNKVKELETRQFKSKAEYQKTLKQFHYTKTDVEELLKIEILSQKIQEKFAKGASAPSEGEAKDYYEAAKGTQYVQPPSRDVRMVLNKDKKKTEEAKALLEKDDSPANWTKVAKKYSTDIVTKESGGLRAGLTENALEEPVNAAVFNAPKNKLEGPIKGGADYYVFEVEKETEEKVQSFDEVKKTISQQLKEQAGQENLTSFAGSFESKWRSRTFCGPDYLTPRCDNFTVNGDPATREPASEKCRQDVPSKELPEACPAPVAQAKPAQPGSVTPLEKHGKPLAQRPQPAHLEQSEENTLSAGGSIPISPTP